MNKQTVLTFMLCIFSLFAYAQQSITVKGTVTDTDNNPLIGAAVAVVGTSSGVITDLDGNYTIKVSPTQSLRFSYVGYEEQTIKVNGRTTINVRLVEGQQLDEVIVIGYGTAKKSTLSGAVASVSAKELQGDIARSAANALQGKVAGVNVSTIGGQPGSGMNVNIRGIGSINNTNTPLYVIDGVYGDINMVDPADIASMEILKDASAAAIYGSRAANGVVLITTKSGHKETKAKISANVYSGIQMVTKTLDVMNADQWSSWLINNYYTDPSKTPNVLKTWQGGAGTNWQDEIFYTAPVTKATVGINGGSKTATYSISAGYLNQKGILRTTGYESFNLRVKNSFSFFNDHFRIGSTIMMKSWNKDYDDFRITDALRQNSLVPVYDDTNEVDGFGRLDESFKNIDNPMGHLYVNDFERHGLDLLINAYAEVDLFVKGLKYKLNVGVNKNNYRDSQWKGKYYWQSQCQNSNPNLNESSYFEDQWLIENTLHYDNTFGKHTIGALLGYSAQDFNSHGIGAYRDGFMDGAPHTINAAPNTGMTNSGSKQENSLVSLFGRFMYSYADRYMLSASVRRDGSSRFADGHRYGWFPSVSVGWNIANEAFFERAKEVVSELKLRGSYGVLGNQEIGNYRTQATLTTGLNYMQGAGDKQTSWQGMIPNASWVSPQDLTWEESKTWDIGIDMGFFNNKLTLTADYYNRRTENLLLGISMASNGGLIGSPTMNAGTIENKGFEFSINHRNTIGDVYYYVGLNASTVSNKVKEVTLGNKQEFGGYNPQGEGTITYSKVGYPIGGFFLTKTDGIFQNPGEIQAHSKDGKLIQPNAEPGDIRFVDYNNDGQISIDDRQYCGTPFPKWNLGFRLGGEWKGIDLNLFFDGVFGNKIYNYTRARMESTNELNNYAASILNSWTKENPNTNMPRYVKSDDNGNYSRWTDRWLENGSYFRLKTLELGYTLPKVFTSKFMIDNLRIYTAMDNLFTATKYKGYSPDLGANDDMMGGGDGIMTTGCDHGRYPLARTITFGIQLDF